MDRSITNILRVKNLRELLDLNTIVLSKEEEQEKIKIVSNLEKKVFLNVEELYVYVTELLPSRNPNIYYRMVENIQQFVCFSNLINSIETLKKGQNKTFSLIGSGLRTFGAKFRSKPKVSTISDAVRFFIKKGRFSENSGNVLRKVGESFSGLEGTTLFRVIHRTLQHLNPFNKNSQTSKSISKSEHQVQLKSPHDNLLAVVYALNKNFRKNMEGKEENGKACKLYIQYLNHYGFKDNQDKLVDINGNGLLTDYFDETFCEGVAVFLYKEMLEKNNLNEASFVDQCFKYMERFQEMVDFGNIKVSCSDLRVSEIKNLKVQYLGDKKDELVKVDDIRNLKREILIRKKMIETFKKAFLDMEKDERKKEGLFLAREVPKFDFEKFDKEMKLKLRKRNVMVDAEEDHKNLIANYTDPKKKHNDKIGKNGWKKVNMNENEEINEVDDYDENVGVVLKSPKKKSKWKTPSNESDLYPSVSFNLEEKTESDLNQNQKPKIKTKEKKKEKKEIKIDVHKYMMESLRKSKKDASDSYNEEMEWGIEKPHDSKKKQIKKVDSDSDLDDCEILSPTDNIIREMTKKKENERKEMEILNNEREKRRREELEKKKIEEEKEKKKMWRDQIKKAKREEFERKQKEKMVKNEMERKKRVEEEKERLRLIEELEEEKEEDKKKKQEEEEKRKQEEEEERKKEEEKKKQEEEENRKIEEEKKKEEEMEIKKQKQEEEKKKKEDETKNVISKKEKQKRFDIESLKSFGKKLKKKKIKMSSDEKKEEKKEDVLYPETISQESINEEKEKEEKEEKDEKKDEKKEDVPIYMRNSIFDD